MYILVTILIIIVLLILLYFLVNDMAKRIVDFLKDLK